MRPGGSGVGVSPARMHARNKVWYVASEGTIVGYLVFQNIRCERTQSEYLVAKTKTMS
jgi:hypothetical protein